MPRSLSLGPVDHGRTLTVEEFEAARWQGGYQYELIRGRLYVSPRPDLPHDRIAVWLFGWLCVYFHQHPEVINYVTAKGRVMVPAEPRAPQPEPDLAAYHDFPRRRPIADLHWRDVSPILVGEVVSEEDPDKDLVRNVELYLEVPSIREYWILDPRDDPDRPTLLVYRRRGQRWQRVIEVAAGDTYTTRLLPGFMLHVDPHDAV